MSIDFHSADSNFEISPVRKFGLSAATSGRRLRAKIMNAFMGRLGVPSGLMTVMTVRERPVKSTRLMIRTLGNKRICVRLCHTTSRDELRGSIVGGGGRKARGELCETRRRRTILCCKRAR